MPEERKISPAVIIPVGLGLGLIVALAALAWAAPPEVYTCPYCGAEFATEEELLAHIELEHPGMPPPEGLAMFYMPAEIEVRVTDGTIVDMYWNCEFSVLITNTGDAPGTHTINWWDSEGVNVGSQQITLQPGESYLWHLSQWVDFRRIASYTMWLSGDWEQNNLSVGIATP